MTIKEAYIQIDKYLDSDKQELMGVEVRMENQWNYWLGSKMEEGGNYLLRLGNCVKVTINLLNIKWSNVFLLHH